ncbi:hypothetical protein IW261DRAFT_1585767 [Armillaria novae-zelandiae]|uniref:BTB domain-containing protein n=1 Tax=Armillaria novae-zelandiae TaxID=153914 RepID=A0AA39NX12_9AGAR|nr:hypothetical protein IW261DRAFT_1585767 [Armillaria novae-zelandiae]
MKYRTLRPISDLEKSSSGREGNSSRNQAHDNSSVITSSSTTKDQMETRSDPTMSSWMYTPSSVPNSVANLDEFGLTKDLVPAPPGTNANLSPTSFIAHFVSSDVEECASRVQLGSQANDYMLESYPPPPPHQHINAVSTKFNADLKHNGKPPDIQLVSSDLVLFLVHHHMLANASTNRFNTLLDSLRPCTTIPETSDFLNIILHAIYGHSCSQFQPNIDTLMTAVCLFPKYGLQPKRYIHPSSPLFSDIRYQMPLSPLTTYVVSSYYELEDLAVITSGHLLALDIFNMSEETVEFINPVYLKRLFDLQQRRLDTLKRLFAVPPNLHPATPRCDFIAQKSFTRAWSLYTTRLLWDARADLTVGEIERTYRTLDDHVTCFDCKCALRERVKGIVIEWSEQKLSTSLVAVAYQAGTLVVR